MPAARDLIEIEERMSEEQSAGWNFLKANLLGLKLTDIEAMSVEGLTKLFRDTEACIEIIQVFRARLHSHIEERTVHG